MTEKCDVCNHLIEKPIKWDNFNLCAECVDSLHKFEGEKKLRFFIEWAFYRKYDLGLLNDVFFWCPSCGRDKPVSDVKFHVGYVTLTCAECGLPYNRLVVEKLK